MTSKFDAAFDYVIENEKGLNTDPTDRGGITNFGISEKFIEGFQLMLLPEDILSTHYETARSYVKCLTMEKAKIIYATYIWLPIYEKIENQDILNFIFDMTVQHGRNKAAELVQRAINANWRHRFIEVDGKFGPATLSEVNSHSNGYATMSVFRSCLIAVRESLFRCIAAHDKTQEDKLEGWLKRCYR